MNRSYLLLAGLLFVLGDGHALAGENVLKNPGFEDTAPSLGGIPNWDVKGERRAEISSKEAHRGKQSLVIPGHTGLEQRIENLEPGAYVARCWIKSEASQLVTLLLQNPDRPWAVYNCTELQVPSNQWVQIEGFCDLDQKGPLTLMLGGTSSDFRLYHGTPGDMASPVLADDCELFRYQPKADLAVQVWDAKPDTTAALDWTRRQTWSPVEDSSHAFAATPVIQGRHVAAAVRQQNGGLAVYAIDGNKAKPRAVIEPTTAFTPGGYSMVRTNDQAGIRVTSKDGAQAYTAWVTGKGLISIEATGIPSFVIKDGRMDYGLLPSFVGTDICYDPQKLPDAKQISIPSTQWFVGLVHGNDSMLVAVWNSDSQSASVGLSGEGTNRIIDSLTIGTEKAGFSLGFVEHPGLWHKETLQEDWLAEYTTIGWQRPFPARWMGHFFVSPGRRPSFREPCMDYSFPAANTKTRLWGVWFENWNHHPFFFDGPRTVVHFEKSFVPQGDALIYFLEPAAADLFSPCEIVEQTLGREKAAALFDFDGNQLRQLKYSTPAEFGYDRPVCATTTRLSKIKQDEKASVGINLVTHLYEFIREIRDRVDQYTAFFDQLQGYLKSEQSAHPEMQPYLAELQGMVDEAKARSKDVYATPLPVVEQKTSDMKKLLLEGKGDGFNCGNLDVRGPAGAQDDLCRRYNRLVLKLVQTAALKCGDSPQKALVAKHIWDESRTMLRRPTRWEPRRTLYFFEP